MGSLFSGIISDFQYSITNPEECIPSSQCFLQQPSVGFRFRVLFSTYMGGRESIDRAYFGAIWSLRVKVRKMRLPCMYA